LAKGTDSNYLPGWCGPATVGIARAKTKIGLANLVYNIKRLLFLRRIAADRLVRHRISSDLGRLRARRHRGTMGP
jgi:hypothetical protein